MHLDQNFCKTEIRLPLSHFTYQAKNLAVWLVYGQLLYSVCHRNSFYGLSGSASEESILQGCHSPLLVPNTAHLLPFGRAEFDLSLLRAGYHWLQVTTGNDAGDLTATRSQAPQSLSGILERSRSSFVCRRMNQNIHNYVKKVLACHTQDLVLSLDCHRSSIIPFCFTFPLSPPSPSIQ